MRTQLRHDLTAALKARDRVAITALRCALAAIDNAEAVPATSGTERTGSEQVALAASGVGATDVQRRDLTDTEIRCIVEREIRDRTTSADEYQRLGRSEAAQRLRAEAAALSRSVSAAR